MKPLVIYHANCADGFTAAWCFHHKDPDGYDFFPGVYNEPPPDVAGRDVFMVDFSYPRGVVLEMAASAKSVTVIDHHQTAIARLAGVDSEAVDYQLAPIYLELDESHSGARLVWDYLFPTVVPPWLVYAVEDRDLWTFNLTNTKPFMAYVFAHEQSFELWDALAAMTPAAIEHACKAGELLLANHDKNVRACVEQSMRTAMVGGVLVPIASVPPFMASDAGNLMSKDALFAATYYDTATHRVFSLRSSETGADVSVIAQEYGGGGHKHAAGFRVPREHELARV